MTKHINIDPLIAAVDKYLAARQLAEEIKNVVMAYKRKILADLQAKESDGWPILEPDRVVYMKHADLKVYLGLCEMAAIENGVFVGSGVDPMLKADRDEVVARRHLLIAGEVITGLPADKILNHGPVNSNRIVNILVRLSGCEATEETELLIFDN